MVIGLIIGMENIKKRKLNGLRLFHLEVCQQVKDIILKTGDKQNRTTAVNGIMTDWSLRHHSCFDNIAEFVESKVGGEVYDIWGAVYNKGDYAGKHSHKGVRNAFVYFVDVCENCASLFVGDEEIKPENGKLIIFKEEEHYTLTQECSHSRIVVAGNVR